MVLGPCALREDAEAMQSAGDARVRWAGVLKFKKMFFLFFSKSFIMI